MSTKLPPTPTEYLEIMFLEEQNKADDGPNRPQNLPFQISTVFNSVIKSAEYLTHGDDVKTVIDLHLDIKDGVVEYQPGDTFGILPQNSAEEVDTLITRLNYTNIADNTYTLKLKPIEGKKKLKIPVHVPESSTVRKALLHNLDIRSVPKKTFLRALSKYTASETERTNLNEICCARYTQFISEEYTTLLELLNKFPSCFPPVTVLLEHLPKLLPRPYSVACSPLGATPAYSEVRFVFSVSYLRDKWEGVCTGWLNKCVKEFLQIQKRSSFIPVYVRKSTNFRLPDDLHRNLIMISSGTGVAPFIGFLQHLQMLRASNENSNFGETWLFYGCRYNDRDFLFKNDLKHLMNKGVLSKLFVAFSREKSNIKYVQDNIKLHAHDFIKIMDTSVIYVCGSPNMSKGVFETILNCLIQVKNITNDEAHDLLNQFKRDNKYVEDVWT